MERADRSGFGAHLVRVSARDAGGAAGSWTTVRQAVAREWENERRESARDASYRKLRGHYTVVVEAKVPAAAAAQR